MPKKNEASAENRGILYILQKYDKSFNKAENEFIALSIVVLISVIAAVSSQDVRDFLKDWYLEEEDYSSMYRVIKLNFSNAIELALIYILSSLISKIKPQRLFQTKEYYQAITADFREKKLTATHVDNHIIHLKNSFKESNFKKIYKSLYLGLIVALITNAIYMYNNNNNEEEGNTFYFLSLNIMLSLLTVMSLCAGIKFLLMPTRKAGILENIIKNLSSEYFQLDCSEKYDVITVKIFSKKKSSILNPNDVLDYLHNFICKCDPETKSYVDPIHHILVYSNISYFGAKTIAKTIEREFNTKIKNLEETAKKVEEAYKTLAIIISDFPQLRWVISKDITNNIFILQFNLDLIDKKSAEVIFSSIKKIYTQSFFDETTNTMFLSSKDFEAPIPIKQALKLKVIQKAQNLKNDIHIQSRERDNQVSPIIIEKTIKDKPKKSNYVASIFNYFRPPRPKIPEQVLKWNKVDTKDYKSIYKIDGAKGNHYIYYPDEIKEILFQDDKKDQKFKQFQTAIENGLSNQHNKIIQLDEGVFKIRVGRVNARLITQCIDCIMDSNGRLHYLHGVNKSNHDDIFLDARSSAKQFTEMESRAHKL